MSKNNQAKNPSNSGKPSRNADKTENKAANASPNHSTNEMKKQAKKTASQPKAGATSPSNTQPQIAPEAAKKGGLVPALALLTGIAGTALGVYNYDQIRRLGDSETTEALKTQIATLEEQVKSLSSANKAVSESAAKQVVAAISKAEQASKAQQDSVNQRLSKVEQLQNGLAKTLQGDLKNTLDQRLNEVNALLNKVDQMELKQKGIAQNLAQMVAAEDATSAEGMAKQEIAYLVRMADYKIVYEGDVISASGLLKIAEEKSLLLSKGQMNTKIKALQQAYQQLIGVESVSNETVVSDLKALAVQVNQLKPLEVDRGEGSSVPAHADGVWGKVETLLVTGGMKVIPGDPNDIDISAETGLIEKRFLQADLFTAELAVRSQNMALLKSSLKSVNTRLDKFFAADDNAKAIKKTLATIEHKKLKVTLPDLSDLVSQFKN